MTEQEIDRVYPVAKWFAELKKTSNAKFLPLFADQHRFLVMKGGGGSGKSIFAGRKVLERVTAEPGHRWLVVRKVARTLRESCFSQLRGQISKHYPQAGAKVSKSEMKISFPNGSEILFAGLDDVEKLKSIYNITGIWIEEASEILESDFNQLDIRLRGETRYYKQIIITFNPISINHWLKKRFFDCPDEQVRLHESTYKDNRFLDEESKQRLEAFRQTDKYYYDVYCLGRWGITGKTVFDAEALGRRLEGLTGPIYEGRFVFDDDGAKISNIKLERDGPIKIYKQPNEKAPYVIGCDTAGDGSDSYVCQVLDNRTGEQVCTLRGSFDEDVFARQLFCLGKYYNDALVGIETNLTTYPVRELERLGYHRQYVREVIDSYKHGYKKAYGFRTDTKTRPIIISELVKVAREHPESINDKTTIEEMLTFVRNPQTLKPEAEAGAHDDCVMALAIAHHIRPQQSYGIETEKRKWTEEMWEDYNAASVEDRQRMREMWGDPE